jgi:uncharacterized protein (TIGR02284 family)
MNRRQHAADSRHAGPVLNRLAQCTRDGFHAFSLAAELATDEDLKQTLTERSVEYGQQATELEYEIKALGGVPPGQGSVTAAAHRGWTQVVSRITNPNILVLEEVGREEDRARSIYEEALNAFLPPIVRNVVERQYRKLIEHSEAVDRLRDRFRQTG